MRLTVVGCSGSVPGPESPASCYLLEADGFRAVLDLGNGALGALQRLTDIYAVDAVLLSHLHPDHCLDLCSYYVARRYGPYADRLPRLAVYGPGDAAARIAGAYTPTAADGAGSDLSDQLDFHAWRSGVAHRIGPFSVTARRVLHPVETFGLRVEHAGRVLAYSADTDACPALVELARDADLFLCEASFAEDRPGTPGLHLTGRGAGQQAALAGAHRLLLTHIPPWNDPQRTLDDAGTSYDGPVELARPAATYDV